METTQNRSIEFDGFVLDPESKLLLRDGETVPISLKEAELLCLLVANHGQVVSNEKILDTIWEDSYVEESNLSRHIYLLRTTLKRAGASIDHIRNIPKRGYQFTGEIHRVSAVDRTLTFEERSITETTIAIEEESDVPCSRWRWSLGHTLALAAILLLFGTLAWQFWIVDSPQPVDGPPMRSIAILPFRMYGEVDESLQMRIADALITRLSGVDGLVVRSMPASRRFLNDQRDVREIGRLLLVDAVVEGTLQREGEGIRINCRAVSSSTGETLWTGQFDGRGDRLLRMQDEIAKKFVSYLDSRRPKDGRIGLQRRMTENADAYENYLTARYFWQKRSYDGLTKAVSFYERSIELDSGFVDAYVGLADAHYLVYEYLYDSSPNRVGIAREYLAKAMRLDPTNHNAYVTLGSIQTSYDWNWQAAERAFKTALDLDPNLSDAHHRLGLLYLRLRRFDEAEMELRKAKGFDPTSTVIGTNLGLVLYSAGKNTDAITQFRSAIELDPKFPSPHWFLARAYWQTGDTRSAFLTYAAALRLIGSEELAKRIEDSIGTKPDIDILEEWIDEWTRAGIDNYSLAILASHKKDLPGTYSLLEAAVEERHPWVSKVWAEPEFSFLVGEVRFRKILTRLRLNLDQTVPIP